MSTNSDKRTSELVILLADDDLEDQEIIKQAFNKIDPTIHLNVVSNGKKAIHHLYEVKDEELPCLIILDYNMPELNGAEVLQQICSVERFVKIPKVILSTSNSRKYVEECLEKGANAYMVKPTNLNDLIGVVKELLALCKAA